MTVTDDFDQFDDAPTPVRKAPAKKAPAKRAPKKAARPANAPEPQDRKAPKKTAQSGDAARRRESDGIDVIDIEMDVKGASITLEVPLHQGDWPVRTAQLFSRGRHIDAIESLLGEEQWEAYLALNPTMNDLASLGGRFSEDLGLGNSGN